MRIDGKTLVLGLIGDPVEHTLSPLIHNSFAECLGLDSAYLPFHVAKEGNDLEEAVRGAYALGIRGLNVTVPHKTNVMRFLKAADPAAEKIGAVNTLVRAEGGFIGYNTDITGLDRDLAAHGEELKGKNVLLIGAGGAARAAGCLCGERGASAVYILNRSPERASQLAGHLRSVYPGMQTAVIRDCPEDADGLPDGLTAIQCTSAGLSPDTESIPFGQEAFYAHIRFAYDLIYDPAETAFLRRCRMQGIPHANGLGMLLHQAVAAYSLWMGSEGAAGRSMEDAVQAAAAALREKIYGKAPARIILIGFMGSGKTSVGRILAEQTGAGVTDMDSLIEERAGKSISQIFAEEGEPHFRDLETRLLEELAADADAPKGGNAAARPVIISAGGGVVLRKANRLLLPACGTVIWLKVSPEEAARRLQDDESRPLLAGKDRTERICRLIEERAALYEEAAGTVIDTDGKDPERIAREIREISGL